MCVCRIFGTAAARRRGGGREQNKHKRRRRRKRASGSGEQEVEAEEGERESERERGMLEVDKVKAIDTFPPPAQWSAHIPLAPREIVFSGARWRICGKSGRKRYWSQGVIQNGCPLKL